MLATGDCKLEASTFLTLRDKASARGRACQCSGPASGSKRAHGVDICLSGMTGIMHVIVLLVECLRNSRLSIGKAKAEILDRSINDSQMRGVREDVETVQRGRS